MHFLKRRYWPKKPDTSFSIAKFVLAAMLFFLGLNIVSSFRAEASTPTPSTWNLLAAGERTAVFPADAANQNNLILNNGSYFYNLSTFNNYAQGSFGFSPNSTITLDLTDIRDSGAGSGQWGLCEENNTGPLRMSWDRRGASGENVVAGYRIGCAIRVAGIRAVYQSNSLPTYYPSGPQRNIGTSTLTNGGWTQCYIGDFQGTVAYSTITTACQQTYILLAGYVGSSSGPTVSTFSSSTATPRNDSNASYSVVFSQSVTGLTTDDFENAGTAGMATGCSFSLTGSGTTYTLSISACSDGTIQPRIKANSVLGSGFDGPASAATATSTITKDSVAPSIPATPDLASDSDLGRSNSDDITLDHTPTINASGIFAGSAIVTAAKSGSTSVTCTVSSGACTLGTLSDGIWSITVTDTDSAGNSSTSSALAITIDRVAPSALTPTSPIYVTPGTNIQIQSPEVGTAQLRNTSTPTDRLSTIINIETVNTSYTVQVPAAFNNQCYLLYVYDLAGNARESSSTEGLNNPYFVCSAPVIAPTSLVATPGNGSVSISFTQPPPTDSSAYPISNYRYSLDGTNYTALSPADSTSPISISGLTNGTAYSITIQAYYATNGGGSSNPSTTVSVTPFAAPDTPDLDAGSDLGTSNIDNNTSDDTPTFSLSSLAANAAVTLTATRSGGGSATCSFISTGSSGSCIFTSLPNGTYSLSAQQSLAGVTSAASSSLTGVVINKATIDTPSVPDLADASDSGISNTDNITRFTTPTISVSGTFTGTRIIRATKAGSSDVTCTVSSGSSCSLGTLAEGVWNVTVTNRDTPGNEATSSALSITVDASRPTLTYVGKSNCSNSPSAICALLQSSEIGTAYLEYGNRAASTGDTFNLRDGSAVSTAVLTANTTLELSASGLSRTNENHRLYVEDIAGNLSFQNDGFGQPGSASAPGTPTSVSASITGSTTATVSFSAPAANGGSSITGYTVTSTPSGAVCAVGANSTTYNCTGLAAGTSYTFKVKATNTVGSGSDSVASSSQTTEANPTIAVALEGSLTVVPITVPVRITATASKPGTITFTQDGTNLNQCVNVQTSESGSNYTATCTWTPALNVSGHGGVRSIVATLTPTSSNYQSVNASKSISVTNIGGVNFPAPSITDVVVSGNSATVSFNVGSPALGPNGYSNDASWINFQYSLDGGTSWNETGTYYYLIRNGDWVNFNAAPSPLVISGLSGQTYNFQIRQQIYHAPGSSPNTYWLVAPSVASPNTGGGSQAYSFTVVAPLSTTTSIATKSLTAGTAATSFTPITASGGGSSKTYSIDPSLPAGLTLNTSTGAITGTPTGATASRSYTVTVNDGSSNSSATFTLGVNAALSSSAGTVPSGVYKDVAVTAFTPVSFSGGTSPVTYSVSPSLPAGLSLNTSTGVISGTATGTASSTPYTVTATDANGDSEESAFAFAVTNQPTAPDAPTNVLGTSTGQTTARVTFTAPTSTGGAAITSYVVTSNPSGATCAAGANSTTYECSGLSAGTAYTFSITATNAAGLTSTSSSPSSSITTETAPIQNNNNGGGGGGGGAPAPAPEPAPEPVCNAACVAAQNAAAKAAADKAAAEKAAADKAAAEKAAAEKLVADKAAAVAVAEKTKVDVSAALAAATAAAEKVSAATAAKAAVDTIAAAVSTVVNSENAAQTSTSKITSEAAASIKSAPAAATKAASTASANTKANTAATQVKAAATAAQKAAASSQAQTSAAPEISFGSSNTASAASQTAAKADAAARAGKAAANEVAAAAEAKSIESRATATALQNEANAAVAEVIAEQKVASSLATEAKAAADKASTATAEKIAATAAAKTATETLVTLLTEKVAIAEKVATAASEEVRAEAQKSLDTVNIKIAEAERAVTETLSKADAAIAAQAEAIKVAEATKATAEAQVTKLDQLRALVPVKATAAVRAVSVAAVAEKVATAAKAAAAKIPSRAAISATPGVSTGKNSTRATISGLKPGQKVKVTVNVKSKP